jgi:hypothetical protein
MRMPSRETGAILVFSSYNSAKLGPTNLGHPSHVTLIRKAQEQKVYEVRRGFEFGVQAQTTRTSD